jgi:outer membrane protein TolC
VPLPLAILLAAVAAQNPTIDPNTGMVRDVQPRVEPPVVTPRPSPEVGSTSTTAPPNMSPPVRPSPQPGDVSAPPGRTPLRRPGGTEEPQPQPPTTTSSGQPQAPQVPQPSRTPGEIYPLSFATETLELSQVLKTALDNNLDLRSSAFDVAISEKNIMVALGAYDVFMTSSLYASKAVTPQRGSQLALNLGQKQIGGSIGFERKLETGGTVNLTIGASRGITVQPLNVFNAAAGTTNLASYLVAPTLTLTHPLLRNAGLKVNRADIDRARINTSRAEAGEMLTAQTIVHDLILAYWDLLFASRDLDNKRRTAATTAEQHRRVQAEVTAGRKSQLDLDTIYQSLVARENDVVLAENILLDRSLTLRTLMGQDFVDRKVLGIIPQTDPQSIAPAPVDLNAKLKQALDYHPQLKQLNYGLATQRIDELVAANKRLPQLDTRFIFSPQGRSIDAAARPDTGTPPVPGSWSGAFKNFITRPENRDAQGLLADYSVRIELNLQWDLQNRAPRATHERILLEMRRAEAQLRRAQQNISMAVIRAVNAQRTAGARMTITAEAVRLAQSNLRAEEARNRVGRSTSYDVLFRQDELAIAEFNALNAQIDYLRATVELQTLTGELLPTYGLELASRAARISQDDQARADPGRYK